MKIPQVEIGKREIEDVPLVESAPRYTATDADESDQSLLGETPKGDEGQSK